MEDRWLEKRGNVDEETLIYILVLKCNESQMGVV